MSVGKRKQYNASLCFHWSDVIMSPMTSQITGVSIVCSTVGSGGVDILFTKLTFEMSTVQRELHSFSTHEGMFFWMCLLKVFATGDIWTRGGIFVKYWQGKHRLRDKLDYNYHVDPSVVSPPQGMSQSVTCTFHQGVVCAISQGYRTYPSESVANAGLKLHEIYFVISILYWL